MRDITTLRLVKKKIFKSLEKVHNHPLLWLSRNHHARKEIKCKSKLFVCTSGYQWSSSPGKNIVLKKYFKNSWGKSIYGSWSCLSRFWILASRQNYCVTSREKTESNNILTPGLKWYWEGSIWYKWPPYHWSILISFVYVLLTWSIPDKILGRQRSDTI